MRPSANQRWVCKTWNFFLTTRILLQIYVEDLQNSRFKLVRTFLILKFQVSTIDVISRSISQTSRFPFLARLPPEILSQNFSSEIFSLSFFKGQFSELHHLPAPFCWSAIFNQNFFWACFWISGRFSALPSFNSHKLILFLHALFLPRISIAPCINFCRRLLWSFCPMYNFSHV